MEELEQRRLDEVSFYESLYRDSGANYGYPRERPARALECVRGILPDVRSALDVSAGRGDFARLLGRERRELAVHVSESFEALLEHDLFGFPRFRWVLPAPCPVAGARWDLVACLDVLEHLLPEDTEGALRSLADTAGRFLLLSIALFPCSWSGRETHINLRAAAEWVRVLRDALGESWSLASSAVSDEVLWYLVRRVAE